MLPSLTQVHPTIIEHSSVVDSLLRGCGSTHPLNRRILEGVAGYDNVLGWVDAKDTAGTIRNETVTFLQNVSVSLRKSSSVSVSLHPGTRTLPGVTDSLRSCGLHLRKFPKNQKSKKSHLLHKTCTHIKKVQGPR